MATYRQKVPRVEAEQWNGGSHPNILIISAAWCAARGLVPSALDEECGQPWSSHGWLTDLYDGALMCPGDYLITDEISGTYRQPKGDFEARWELLP